MQPAIKRVTTWALFSVRGTSDAAVLGVSPSHFQMVHLPVAAGRALHAYDDDTFAQVAVLGARAARARLAPPRPPAMVEAPAAIATAAKVELVAYEKTGGRYVTAIVRGDVAAVKAAVEAGARGAEKVGEVVAIHVIPRPHGNVDRTLPLGRTPGEPKKSPKA